MAIFNHLLQNTGKTQKSIGSVTAQNGTKSDEGFRRPAAGWSKQREPQRRSGSGKEVL